MNKRYYVAVDIQNLWYSCRNSFGTGYRVDYRQLLEYIYDITEGAEPTITCVAYLIASPNHDQTNFLSTLRNLGFRVKKRNLHYDQDKRSATNTNWDVGITVDAFLNLDNYDTFILISGDGDFVYMVDPIMDKGKEVIVASFEKSLNKGLANAANKVYYLEDDVVYSPHSKYRPKHPSHVDFDDDFVGA